MKNFRIQERSPVENTVWYLEVQPHYENAEDGKDKTDAVYFEMGQWGEHGHELDAGITCHVEDAKAFANSILKACKEIEGE
ncbi:hypothetical protein CIL05_12760 [Virgibacillus profundi]|uniref:Uncharacterized protein n=1 Tax=Virgibacillus profundi TaxID=2024555 RepID=A0A2A2IB81_9BACI|nr:hypothetical protein [Virgibacillus profundi]PAV29261.1 hypothetical protein CIL05_12760 [Virgibacillus profundi]PXY53430.1 hypothetical protein CIT14_12885 [Virgibacillus profundi]